MKLMTINMLKRLESCVESFRITLRKVRDVNRRTFDSIEEYERNKVQSTMEFSQIETENFEDDDFDITNESTLGKVKIDFADMDLRSWKADLKKDIEDLDLLYGLMSFVTPDKDLKLQKLIEVIENKINNPINSGNRKVLIFSAFADTTNYTTHKISFCYTHIPPTVLYTYFLDCKTVITVFNYYLNTKYAINPRASNVSIAAQLAPSKIKEIKKKIIIPIIHPPQPEPPPLLEPPPEFL